MKNIFFVVLCACISAGSLLAGDVKIKLEDPGMRLKIEYDDDYKVYKKHGDIIIENEDSEEEVAISEEGELWVNGDKVRVRRSERTLLVEYHELALAILEKAEDIGEEGVKVGLKGAELGVKAATGVFKILLPGYTAEDFEEEMEEAAEKIEKKAEKLEKQAEKLETMSEHLQDIQDDLRARVDELEELEWF